MKNKQEALIVITIVVLLALVAWNLIPGLRWAAPHRVSSATDSWTPPGNAPIPDLPCQSTEHPSANWRPRADGGCYAEDWPRVVAPAGAPGKPGQIPVYNPKTNETRWSDPPFAAVEFNGMEWCIDQDAGHRITWRPRADGSCWTVDLVQNGGGK